MGADVTAVLARDPFELAAPLASLTRDDLEVMDAGQAEVVVAATQRLINSLAAIQLAAVTTHADRIDEDLDRYRQERRHEFEERRDRAQVTGRAFTERWFPIPGGDGFAAASLAPLLRVSPRAMAGRITRARRVDHEMTRTWARARDGDLEPHRVEAIVRASTPLHEDDLDEFEARLFCVDVTGLPTGELARRARRAATATNRRSVEECAARTRARRSVACGPDPDLPGLTLWRMALPTESSRRVWAAVDELARQYHDARRDVGDPVTLDQARADALVDLVLARASVETTVELVVPVAALAGSAATSSRAVSCPDTSDDGPGIYRWAEYRSPSEVLRQEGVSDDLLLQWVSGHELHLAAALEAEYALLLADHLTIVGNPNLSHAPPGSTPGTEAWFVPGHVDVPRVGAVLPDDLTALLADPTTLVRVVGSDPTTGAAVTDASIAYRPGGSTARRVRRRDGTCRFPGCATPAERTQLDHVVRWPDGPTRDDNLVCLCTAHHGFKHHAGWTLTMTPEGVCTWTAPTGRSHTTHPADTHSRSV